MIEHIAVVVPARNEEELIGACLASIADACTVLDPAVAVSVIVVADECHDATADIARAAGAAVVEVGLMNVGAVRRVGARIAGMRGADWMAITDADSRVPVEWLQRQVELERAGVDLMLGTVRPDFGDLSDDEASAWLATHPSSSGGRIYGANLGIRMSSYCAIGEFRDLAEHEDVDLVARAGDHGVRIVSTDACEVVTSGRREGRTPGGFASFLRSELTPLSQTLRA